MIREPHDPPLPVRFPERGEGIGELDPNIIAARAEGAHIAENVLRFARALRAAGLPIGPDRVALAMRAIMVSGIESPNVLYWALHAALVSRREQHELFDQAFHLFWKEAGLFEQELSSAARGPDRPPLQRLPRRLSDALFSRAMRSLDADATPEFTRAESYSAEEAFRQKDFEQMSAAEQRRARTLIARMSLLLDEIPTRRFESNPAGDQIDVRRVLRETAARGPDHIVLSFRRRKLRRPPLVVLCDISGSMDTYARTFLHFVYALTNARDRVHTFLFGTRLTNVTRMLRGRDPDAAIARVSNDVKDWSGGTRIGATLAEFNRVWARRVLGQNAVVLFVTDGLDREDGDGVAAAARRLRASCRRLVWLNPLVRYDRYAPLALGARALRPHVSEVRACHNLASLEELAAALASRSAGRPSAHQKRAA